VGGRECLTGYENEDDLLFPFRPFCLGNEIGMTEVYKQDLISIETSEFVMVSVQVPS